MKAVNIGAAGFPEARLRQRWSGAGEQPVISSPPPEPDTRHVGEFERLGSYVYDQPVSMIHAPRVDWMDDPR
jgi:hypothetical protein